VRKNAAVGIGIAIAAAIAGVAFGVATYTEDMEESTNSGSEEPSQPENQNIPLPPSGKNLQINLTEAVAGGDR
jgi:hypothetical protein